MITMILVYALIFTSFLSDWTDLADILGGLSKVIAFLPDLIAGVLALSVLFRITQRNPIILAPKYIFIGVTFILTIIVGFLLNDMNANTIVLGIRDYLRFIPIFLVPAVFSLSEKEMKKILLFILALSLLQTPVGIYQYLTLYPIHQTGDVVRGTLSNSGILSVYQCAVISILYAFYLSKSISLTLFVGLSAVLMVPVILNDSRATLVLILVGIFTVGLFDQKSSRNKVQVISFTFLTVFVLAGSFVLVYDKVFADRYSQRYEGGLLEFYLQGAAEDDFYKKRAHDVGKGVGRLDSIIFALEESKNDISSRMLGLGAGNVRQAPIKALEGEYVQKYADYGVKINTISNLLWETGLFGVILCISFLVCVWFDTKKLASNESPFISSFALGWLAATTIIIISLVYKEMLLQNVSAVLIMFLSGYIAAEKRQQTQG